MFSTPIKGMTANNISQIYHSEHPALDIISFTLWYERRGAGTPLCSPELVQILKIVGDTYTPHSDKNLERGYGIYLKGLDTGYTHFFWHTTPHFPVNVEDIIPRGKIVAFMSNSGYVYSEGAYVPLSERTKEPMRGTHLHWETFDKGYKIGDAKKFVNPLDHLVFTSQPTYTEIDHILAVAKTLQKTLKIIQ